MEQFYVILVSIFKRELHFQEEVVKEFLLDT